MSEPLPPESSTPSGAAAAATVAAPAAAPALPVSMEPAAAWWQARWWAWLLLAVGGLALLLAVLLWQKIGNIQEELARRSLDAGTQAVEARTIAQQANEAVRESGARLASMEARLGEVALQRQQLEELMQSLSRSRDENLVVDIESALRLAQQQAQFTGSAEPLLAALRTAEQRLQRASQPRLASLQRAIVQDADRIRAASLTDIPALLIKLDELARLVDDLPVANDVAADLAARTEAPPRPATVRSGFIDTTTGALQDWLVRAWSVSLAAVQQEARQLLRISRIDTPDAALLAPEQAFFLRENTKLKLLNARLALLSRQTEVARADLLAVQSAMQRYFDGSARKTQVAAGLLQQIQGQLKTTELPRLDRTLAALATAAAGR